MAKFAEIVKKGQTFICEKCQKDVNAKDIKLQDPISNCEILTPLMPFIFVDKYGTITGGSKMAKEELGDKVLSCPYCDHIHLYGFELKT
ncbi:MAG: hypothetical protein ACFFG0_00505 [Candidatus Thorarchaeota archaeon]